MTRLRSMMLGALWVPCASLAFFAVAAPQEDPAQRARDKVMQKLVAESPIVFVGSVTDVGGVSFADVPKDTATVVMRIEQVALKPEALAMPIDGLVTVEVRSLSLLEVGRRATVFAQGWIVGDGIAVREVGAEIHGGELSLSQAQVSRLGNELARAQESNARSALEAGLVAADLVVRGRVQSVRQVSAELPRQPISEHMPQWREAVVRVEEPLKGADAGDEVVIRFASSDDATWYKAPKLREGQAETFCVHVDRVTGAPMAMLNGADVRAFVAIEPGSLLTPAQIRYAREYLGK